MPFSHFIFLMAIVSTVLCLAVLLFMYFDPRSRKSLNSKLVFRLLLSDACISALFIMYYFIESNIGDGVQPLQDICAVYLSFPIFFFLASWGWTILLALRFRNRGQSSKSNRIPDIPVPMWSVWAASFVLILPTLIAALFSPTSVSEVEDGPGTNHACVYSFSNRMAKAINIFTFQIPLLITLGVNIYSYSRGLKALRNAPQSVIGRQMNKAGGYIIVLIGVWAPNFVFNVMRIHHPHDKLKDLLNASLVLSSIQGILNVIVYFWSSTSHRKRFIDFICCSPKVKNNVRSDQDKMSLQDASNQSLSRQSESILRPSTTNILIDQCAVLAMKATDAEYEREITRKQKKGAGDANPACTNSGMSTEEIIDARNSFSHKPKKVKKKKSKSDNRNSKRASASASGFMFSPMWTTRVQNPYDRDEKESDSEEEDEFEDSDDDYDDIERRSDDSRDSEKMVRFGINSTRMISLAKSFGSIGSSFSKDSNSSYMDRAAPHSPGTSVDTPSVVSSSPTTSVDMNNVNVSYVEMGNGRELLTDSRRSSHFRQPSVESASMTSGSFDDDSSQSRSIADESV